MSYDLPIQVGIFMNDSPATDKEARDTFNALGWVIEERVDDGVWLVFPHTEFRETFNAHGFAELDFGKLDISAEDE
ncbi:hypothetical protein UFOVP2_19 [uncultured Caudovirales phage]|uniref:Uncharacterized protein n=1 Tax=uncultured Caudovirales phage TaxID=2100421 RepID=A0A6J5KH80_9CAUD|nr:hypothetical protein UFOVP2_19 [uncultured Caudovirales phage]